MTTKPPEEVVILKIQKSKQKAISSHSSRHAPIKDEEGPNGVKGRVRSINRVFSRISSMPSAKSSAPQLSVDGKGHLTLTQKPSMMNRVVSKVFNLKTAGRVVITSARKVEGKNLAQARVIRVQSADGVVITSTRMDKLRAKSSSTLLTVPSQEDEGSNHCDGALDRSQLQKDALLLAKAKQAVQPTRAKDKRCVRSTSTPDTFIITVDKTASKASKEPSSNEGDEETSIFWGAVDACSMRLCFERDEEEFIVIVPEGFLNDDLSSISGLSRFFD